MDRIGTARLYLLFTPALCRSDAWQTLAAALRGGVDLVQWRCKERDLDGARRCRATCATFDVPLIVNDDVDLAIELDAAGAHVGQDDLPARLARERLGPERRLGVSTHSLAELERAIADGADHVGFGPMFATATKGYARGQPTGALRAVLARAAVPVFPIGGIHAERIPALRAEGATRAAVSSAILAADDPERTTATLRAALDC